jgi:hypothetical protein
MNRYLDEMPHAITKRRSVVSLEKLDFLVGTTNFTHPIDIAAIFIS